ncbi:hypothetical protein SEUCBS139899_009935 [Sporothrix eucalyptigena]|uniref:EGF domain-specific O-linked N-acetylglucosamine transferase n=1 Tax=Sporothrix eucalyptigena TaxID=1812306 RepID=A0ABP0B9D6_9PEZI
MHFASAYLDELRNHSIQYCSTGEDGIVPASQLTCFHAHIRDDPIADSFCIGSGATWDAPTQRFRLDCPTRRLPDANETARGLIPFKALQPQWFETGPKYIFNHFVVLGDKDKPKPSDAAQLEVRAESEVPTSLPGTPSFVILVKREGASNLWHSLMEIWSMTMTMDVLRMSRKANGEPFYQTHQDMDNTHVVVLDDHGPGPTLDMWRFFSRNPIVTFKNMVENPDLVPAPFKSPEKAANTNIIVPLPGGSNPLWHGDWAVKDCTPEDAPLLKLFIKRVFEHFDVPLLLGPKLVEDENDKIVVTFIDRRGTRQLLGNEKLLDALHNRYPDVTVQSVDFATLPLPEQLRLIQDTDVLVGVHGAGLTHTMFMRAGAGAVVEILPDGLGYKGFRNLAAMTGHKYFSGAGTMVMPEELEEEKKKEGDGKQNERPSPTPEKSKKQKRNERREEAKKWQLAHVRIEEDRFLALMDVAIKSVYNEGLRNEYVIKR